MNVEINPSNIESCRTIARPDLCALLGGISKDTVRRMVRRGELPPPMRISGTNHWLETQVFEFIEREQRKLETQVEALEQEALQEPLEQAA